MLLAQSLNREAIKARLTSTTKDTVLKELADLVLIAHHLNLKENLLALLKQREELQSTGIGEGVAIPHTNKVLSISKCYSAFGISKEGIEFRAIDRKPTHFFVVIVAPYEQPNLHLELLAGTARLLKDDKNRKKLLTIEDNGKLLEMIRKIEKGFGE